MTDKMADQLFAPAKICPKNRINKPFRRNGIFISADDFESSAYANFIMPTNIKTFESLYLNKKHSQQFLRQNVLL